jgi:glycine C-acetyltransferase
MSKLGFLEEELNSLREQGLYNNIRTITGPQGAWFVVDGKKVLNLCSNNYLGFAHTPELKSGQEAVDEYGVGPGAVRTKSGTRTYLKLEEKLAKFKHAPACIVVQAGFTANTVVIPTITGEGDFILSDELNHASIIDGCRLSKAKVVRYAHNSIDDLRKKLSDVNPSPAACSSSQTACSHDATSPRCPPSAFGRRVRARTRWNDAHCEGVLC